MKKLYFVAFFILFLIGQPVFASYQTPLGVFNSIEDALAARCKDVDPNASLKTHSCSIVSSHEAYQCSFRCSNGGSADGYRVAIVADPTPTPSPTPSGTPTPTPAPDCASKANTVAYNGTFYFGTDPNATQAGTTSCTDSGCTVRPSFGWTVSIDLGSTGKYSYYGIGDVYYTGSTCTPGTGPFINSSSSSAGSGSNSSSGSDSSGSDSSGGSGSGSSSDGSGSNSSSGSGSGSNSSSGATCTTAACTSTPGAPSANSLYTKNDSLTFEGALGDFSDGLQATEVFKSSANFLSFKASGSCPSWVIPSVSMPFGALPSIPIDMFCADVMTGYVYPAVKAVVISLAAFVAFTWALL